MTLGPNVHFGGHVAIQPGATVLTQQGYVPAPVAVSTNLPSGGPSGSAREIGGIVFTKSAGTPCKKAGVHIPVHTLDGLEKMQSIAVGQEGEIVVSETGSMKIFSPQYEQLVQRSSSDFSGVSIAIDVNNTIVAIAGPWCVMRLNMQLHTLSKVSQHDIPSLKSLTHAFALALGSQGRLYIAGAKKCHILNEDFTYNAAFAEERQAYAIAVSTSGNVYVPFVGKNILEVFSPDGNPLFQFGGPDRPPVPQMSLLAPMGIALDHHDNVYVGNGMKGVVVFDKEGKFLEPFGKFEQVPAPLYVDHNRHLYVGEKSGRGKKIQIFELEN